MFYLSTGLAGCLVDPENNRGVRKLARTPRVIKKKKNTDALEVVVYQKKDFFFFIWIQFFFMYAGYFCGILYGY
jgi:hypothetical protein